MSGPFELALAAFAEKAGNRANDVVRKVVIDVTASVVDKSPVGNPDLWKRPAPEGYVGGRFRANWTLQEGSVDYTTTEAIDAGGEATKGRLSAAVPDRAAGKVYFVANSLPYANALEWGRSTQAPEGMVRRTVDDFQSYVNAAVASLSQ